MSFLIDTHVCVWAMADKKKLPKNAKHIIENNRGAIFVSAISFFEIAIKLKIGRLPEFNVPLPEFIKSVHNDGFQILPFKEEHFSAYLNFDFSTTHRDPFDRYLIASACFEKMALISKDEKFQIYSNEMDVIW